MKPRETSENQQITSDVEQSLDESSPEQVSETAVQAEVPEEVPAEPFVGNSEGGDLESSSLQNLDSGPEEAVPAVENEASEAEKEVIVAQTTGFDPQPAVLAEGDLLAEMLKRSEEVSGSDPKFVDQTTRMITFEDAAKMGLPPVEGADGYTIFSGSGPMQPTIAEMEDALLKGTRVDIAPDGKVTMMPPVFCGELPNGEYRATVRIREGYWEGVVSAAAADDMPVEDWLTRELGERLEDRFFGRP